MASVCGSVACGALLNFGGDDDAPPPPVETPPSGADAAPPPPPVVEGGVSPSCTTRTKQVELQPVADTCLFPAGCPPGSISDGRTPFCNIGLGVFLARFELSDEVAAALRSGKVTAMSLSLFDNRTCDSAEDTCNVSPKPGSIAVHVLRNDWVEYTEGQSTYSGADRCRRTGGNPGQGWGTAAREASGQTPISSPADYGERIGGGVVANTEITSVSLLLEPSKIASDWARYAPDSGAGARRLSLLVEPDGDSRIVVGTREAKLASPPLLRLEICE